MLFKSRRHWRYILLFGLLRVKEKVEQSLIFTQYTYGILIVTNSGQKMEAICFEACVLSTSFSIENAY